MRIADQIRDYLRRLHPDQRRLIRAALTALAEGRAGDVLPLTDDLEGFYRLRAGRFRIIYRILADGGISCEFIDVRATVYERFTSMQEMMDPGRRPLNEPPAVYGMPKAKRRLKKPRSH